MRVKRNVGRKVSDVCLACFGCSVNGNYHDNYSVKLLEPNEKTEVNIGR